MGAFPVVRHALDGFVVDDIWVYNDVIYRVAARPVIDRGGYVGAIVHCSEISSALVQRLASRLSGASLAFFLRERLVATHIVATEGAPQPPQIEAALATVFAEPELQEEGKTGPKQIGDGFGVFALVTGSASHTQVGYVLTRPVQRLSSPMALFEHENSFANVPWIYVIGLFLILGLIGIVFSLLGAR